MTITYPRTLIDNVRMQEAWIDLIDPVAMQPSARGNVIKISQVNDPVWKGTFVTGILERDKHAIWSAWRKSLRSSRTFVAFDVRKKTPRAYPTAVVPGDILALWDGTCDVASIGLSGALELEGLPLAAYQFKAGDRIGLEEGGKYGYYEVLEDVTAASFEATVTVAPFLHDTLFTVAAVCRLWRPVCQFILDQSSWSEQGTVEKTPISFNGVQRL
jgi:hypothetical protein